ncbi:MAG: J domain-containing protein, partial [Cyanobacteria bacterium J06606_4]
MDQIEQAYRVLELALDTPTSMREVNQAYKDLVFIWHPDRIPSDRERLREKAEAKLKTLNEARSFLRSQAKNGRLPAVTTAKKEATRTSPYGQNSHRNGSRNGSRTSAYSRSNRTYSTYRPGDDSTYRPSRDRATARSTYTQTAAANGNSRGSGYRPPYEAYRRAAAAASSGFAGQYGATYRARYPSSPWPRQSEAARSSATNKSTDKASANSADKASSKANGTATGKTASKATSSKATSAKGTGSKDSSKTASTDTKKKSTAQSSTSQSSRSSEKTSAANDSYKPARTKRNP